MNDIRNPPVGPKITPNPPVPPENTGTPIAPMNKYAKIVIKLFLGLKNNPINIIITWVPW